MRSTDEQLHEIMQRADHITEMRSIRRHMLTAGASSLTCVVMLVIVSMYIPHITMLPQETVQTQYGSLLLAAPYLGYIIVGVIAFALGICVAILCMKWKQLKDRERK